MRLSTSGFFITHSSNVQLGLTVVLYVWQNKKTDLPYFDQAEVIAVCCMLVFIDIHCLSLNSGQNKIPSHAKFMDTQHGKTLY